MTTSKREKKERTEEDRQKERDAEMKRVSLKELKKEVGKMPVFNLANPPDLEKDIGDTV